MTYKRIILVIFLSFMFSSCMGVFSPIANTPTSLKQGDSKVTIAGGMLSDSSGDRTERLVFPYLSYQKKTQEDVTYEFYIFGVKRIDELYKGNRFYFAVYESIYAPMYVVGVNLGLLMGYRIGQVDFFLSAKVDGAVGTMGIDEKPPFGAYATGSAGINFGGEIFIEFSVYNLLFDTNTDNGLIGDSLVSFVYLGFII